VRRRLPACLTAGVDAAAVLELLEGRRLGWSLPGPMYHDADVFALDLAHVWHREWVFAGLVCELAEPGDYLTLQVGAFPLVVIRGGDGELRALHNVCRHRGSVICEEANGRAGRRLVCPYHQWTYDLAGRHVGGRSMPADVDPAELGLRVAHCATIGGLVFVCVATDPPDVAPLRSLVEPYLAPFDLERAIVAHRTTFVEHANWKLVMENNRECYHCRLAHPELCVSFPAGAQHNGAGTSEQLAELEELVARAEAAGLPSRLASADDHHYRVMRLPFEHGATGMTLDGRPAFDTRFGGLPPHLDLGDVLLYHYPSSWNHFMADHAVTFRLLPVGPGASQLHTTWLVPEGTRPLTEADLERLTAVWLATNAQDATLVARAQRGVTSPAYEPGPYSPAEEEGVEQFVDWYVQRMRTHLGASVRGPAVAAST